MISIIVPVYNGERYIKRLLEDFQNQVMKNFEVIFVDDGSTDKSFELIKKYEDSEKYFFPIKVYRQENKGVSSARNTGIDNSEGEYICFVDVDDSITIDYLSYMYDLILKKRASLVFCKTTKYVGGDKTEDIIEREYTASEALERYLYHDLVSGACSLMIKSNIIKDNNLRFKEGYHYSEDLHMVWRMIHYSDKIIETNKKLYIYMANEGSAMSKFQESRMDSIELMTDLECFFKKNNKQFYPLFKKYGKSRIAWSVLWQAVYNFNFIDFMEFTKTYDFKNELKKLYDYRQNHVKFSSILFCNSKIIYYLIIKTASRKYRKAK